MARMSIFILVGLIVALGLGRTAFADPQVLAAVPAGGPLQLTCEGGVCVAEVSAICLQPERRLPDRGTPYTVRAADLGSITVSGHTRDGRTIALPSSLLRVESQRGQTAVRIFVERQVLAQKGLQSVSVEFDRMIALLPVPAADGTAPQTEADIAKAVSGIARVGEAWTEFNAESMVVARIAVRVGNGLPREGAVSQARFDALLETAANSESNVSPRALHSARNLVSLCQRRSNFKSMRACLGEKHDQIMLGLNSRYWSALAPGS